MTIGTILKVDFQLLGAFQLPVPDTYRGSPPGPMLGSSYSQIPFSPPIMN